MASLITRLTIASLLLASCWSQRCHKQSNETCLEDDKCQWDGVVCYLSFKDVGYGECVGANGGIPDRYVSDRKLTTLNQGQCEYTCSIIQNCIGVRVESNSSSTTCVLYVTNELLNQPHGFSTFLNASNGSILSIDRSDDSQQSTDPFEWFCKARYCDNTDCSCDITSPECGDADGIKGQCACVQYFDECESSPCGVNQSCFDQNTLLESSEDFICTCNNSNHYLIGKPIPSCVIDECLKPGPCHQGQVCIDPNTTSASTGDFICSCASDDSIKKVGAPVLTCSTIFVNECEPSPCYVNQYCIDPDIRFVSLNDYICSCDNNAGSLIGSSHEDCDALLTESGNDCLNNSSCGDNDYCIDRNVTYLGDFDCLCKSDMTIMEVGNPTINCPFTAIPPLVINTTVPETNIPETQVPHEKGVAFISPDVDFVREQMLASGLQFNDSYVGGVGMIILVAKDRILIEFSDQNQQRWLPTKVISLYPWTNQPIFTNIPTVGSTDVPSSPVPTLIPVVVNSSGGGVSIFLFLFIGLAAVVIIIVIVVVCRRRYYSNSNGEVSREPLVSSVQIAGIHNLIELEGIPTITSTSHPLMTSTPKFGFDCPDSPSRAMSLASF